MAGLSLRRKARVIVMKSSGEGFEKSFGRRILFACHERLGPPLECDWSQNARRDLLRVTGCSFAAMTLLLLACAS